MHFRAIDFGGGEKVIGMLKERCSCAIAAPTYLPLIECTSEAARGRRLVVNR